MFATRISRKIRPQDPGGGAARIAAPWGVVEIEVTNSPEVSVVEPRSVPSRISVVLVEEAKVEGTKRLQCPRVDQDQLKWTTDPIKCLGVIINTNRDQIINLNYTPIINKIKTITHFWNKQYMTIFGKVVIITSFLISQFDYLMSVLPTPPLHIVKQIDAQLYTFLWSNKTERIKSTILKTQSIPGEYQCQILY